ncbi:MAG: hypothetical protein HQK84_05425, partial [Nitrospinae bacterium]|nr:hypothetical protein [Nitrospinota bacterium]
MFSSSALYRFKDNNIFWLLLLYGAFFIFNINFFVLKKYHLIHDSLNWYGLYKYFSESIVHGQIPLWDFYTLCGQPFYLAISLIGLLDPIIFLPIFLQSLGLSTFDGYTLFFLLRVFVFITGVFYLFLKVVECQKSAFWGTFIFMIAVTPTFFRQNGGLNGSYLTPFVLLTVIYILENMNKRNINHLLLIFTLLCGIIANIYIPSYFLFYFFLFFISIFLFRVFPFSTLTTFFSQKKNILTCVLLTFLLFLMLIPVLSVYLVDYKDKNTEVLPSLRIMQNLKGFPKYRPTLYVNDTFSKESYKGKSIFNSVGNLLNLIHPDIYKFFFVKENEPMFEFYIVESYKEVQQLFSYRSEINPYTTSSAVYPSEMTQYLGIISVLLIIIALFFSNNRYKKVFIFLSLGVFLEMTSFGDFRNHENIIQKSFDFIFPFLRFIDVKETFSPLFLLSISALAVMGVKELIGDKGERKKLFKFLMWATVSLVLFKLVTLFLLIPFYYSQLNELLTYLILLLFFTFTFLYYKNVINKKAFIILFILLNLADLSYFYSQVTNRILALGTQWKEHIEEKEKTDGEL